MEFCEAFSLSVDDTDGFLFITQMLQVLILSITEATYYLKSIQGVGCNLFEINFNLLEILVIYYGKFYKVGDIISFLFCDFEVDLSQWIRRIFELYAGLRFIFENWWSYLNFLITTLQIN